MELVCSIRGGYLKECAKHKEIWKMVQSIVKFSQLSRPKESKSIRLHTSALRPVFQDGRLSLGRHNARVIKGYCKQCNGIQFDK